MEAGRFLVQQHFRLSLLAWEAHELSCNLNSCEYFWRIFSGELIPTSVRRTFAGLADGVNCYGAIQATSESGHAYFGTPFLQALFVVHDYAGLRLGFTARSSP